MTSRRSDVSAKSFWPAPQSETAPFACANRTVGNRIVSGPFAYDISLGDPDLNTPTNATHLFLVKLAP